MAATANCGDADGVWRDGPWLVTLKAVILPRRALCLAAFSPAWPTVRIGSSRDQGCGRGGRDDYRGNGGGGGRGGGVRDCLLVADAAGPCHCPVACRRP